MSESNKMLERRAKGARNDKDALEHGEKAVLESL